tara:strand:- start:129 stop:602 length:474 start_codon:yes stop_codon:yes gene_type:complete
MGTSTTTCSGSAPLRIKISKRASKQTESKLNMLYPDTDLLSRELEYDLNILPEYKQPIIASRRAPDLKRISKLPATSFTHVDEHVDDHGADQDDEDIDEDISDHDMTMIEDDIDIASFEKETIGNKTYYLDYSKGIIYDLQYKIIGNIDDYGEINII